MKGSRAYNVRSRERNRSGSFIGEMLPISHQEGEHAKEAGQDVPAGSQAEEATHRLRILSGFSNIPPIVLFNADEQCTDCLHNVLGLHVRASGTRRCSVRGVDHQDVYHAKPPLRGLLYARLCMA